MIKLLQNEANCFCGEIAPGVVDHYEAMGCYPCEGKYSEMCGGPDHMSVYFVGRFAIA